MAIAPEISVIIPLYNAEKFIAECLESLSAQTLKNFELIIVDDCSTDSSPAIVESYIPKFGGRLKLSRTKKNSGSGALSRNKGLKLSRGKYVFNMDNDDLLTPTALEELFALAETYDADVVYCEKYFVANDDLSEIYLHGEQEGIFVDRPTLETDDLTERVNEILAYRFWVTPWSKLVKRDVLLDNEIYFPPCKISDDDIWTYELLFCAGKILRVPNAIYVNRRTKNSVTRDARTPVQEITFWLNPLFTGLKSFDDFMGAIEFFRRNPHYRLAMLDHLANGRSFAQLSRYCAQMPPIEIYDAIRQSFKNSLGKQDVLVAYLCTLVHEQRKNLVRK